VHQCSVVVGDLAFNAATIQPIAGDAVPSNNIDTVHQIATASWDPNAKEVSPPGVERPVTFMQTSALLHHTLSEYRNRPCCKCGVGLILSPNHLDWSSIMIQSYSHPMVAVVWIRCWYHALLYFNNIMLPIAEQICREVWEQWKFTAMPKNAIADGAVINNLQTSILINVPVRTNTTVNTIDYDYHLLFQ